MGNFGFTGADVCCACGGGQVDTCPPETVYDTCVAKTSKTECTNSSSVCDWCDSFCIPKGFPNACNNPTLFFSKCNYSKLINDPKQDVDITVIVEDEAYSACPWERKNYLACSRYVSKSSCLKGKRKKKCAWCSDEKGFHCLPPINKFDSKNKCAKTFKQYEKCL